MSRKKYLIAITGGFGSGKSLFSKFLLKKGEFVINSDQIAKELMTTNHKIIEQIKKLLGSQAYNSDGTLNTKYISEKIFSDRILNQKLAKIVHPPTIIEIQRRAQKEFKRRSRVFVESALVFEAKLENKFDYIVLIKSDLALRLKRVIERDRITPDEFYRRIQFQIDPNDAEEHSNFVIYNNGTIEELTTRFEFIYRVILKLTEQKIRNNSRRTTSENIKFTYH